MIDNDRMWASLIKSMYGTPILYWLKNRIDDALKDQGLRYNSETRRIEKIEQDPCTDCKTETEEICNDCEARHDKDKCDELVFGRKCPLQKRDNSELTEFEKEVKGLLFDAGDKYDLNTDLDKATKDLAPYFLEAARKQCVEEACNWLYDMWPQIAESPQFIEDFRKALEKGVKDDIK